MKLPFSVAYQLQWQLRELLDDDSSCASFSAGNIDNIPDNTIHRWQYGVDMIYRCVTTGLIMIPYFQIDSHDLQSFFLAIRSLNPFDSSGGMMWNGTYLRRTDMLRDLLNRFFSNVPQYDPELNVAFVEELENIFQQHAVPWSESPLLPILRK
jgi:hypothetical protein